MLTPAGIRAQVFVPAVEAFMASTGESYEVARACLFGAMLDIGAEGWTEKMRDHYANHPVMQTPEGRIVKREKINDSTSV
jgi:hypothetical protein